MNKVMWENRFLELAEIISKWSKDPSTQVGAVIVSDDRQILSIGYNGFPRGISDDNRLDNREEKYKFVVHAEMNCIYNACHNGISLKNSTLYTFGLPTCHECAKGIIQVGIKNVICRYTKIPLKWDESKKITLKLFEEGNVIYHENNS